MRALFSELQGKQLAAVEGILGSVVDILVDDRFWGTNYFVLDIEAGTGEESILLAAESMLPYTPSSSYLRVRHSIKDVLGAPTFKRQQPVSHAYEKELQSHFGWGIPPFLFSAASIVKRHGTPMDSDVIAEIAAMYEPYGHLRSVRDLIGYSIESEAQTVGQVSDIAFYLDSWSIGLFAVNISADAAEIVTVPMSPVWIKSVSWPDKNILIDLPKDVFFSSPPFEREHLNQYYLDKKLFEHYREHIEFAPRRPESAASR